jgi:AcrR family transcriptional regulator
MPKIVDKRERHRRYIEAAAEVFAERGFSETRMADIAKRAKVSKALLYEYFTSKEDIFLQVCESIVSWGPLSSLDGVPSVQGFSDLVADVAQSYDEAQNFFLILSDFWAAILRGPEEERKVFLDRVESFYETPRKALTNLIRRGQKAGIFRKDIKSAIVANLVIAGIEGIRLQHMLDPRNARKSEALQLLARMILTELVGGDTIPDVDMRRLSRT